MILHVTDVVALSAPCRNEGQLVAFFGGGSGQQTEHFPAAAIDFSLSRVLLIAEKPTLVAEIS